MEVRVVMGTEFGGRGTPNLGTTQRPVRHVCRLTKHDPTRLARTNDGRS